MSECPICLEKNTDFKLECGHSFHNKCICEWLMCNSDSCPTCRKQIIKTEKKVELPYTNSLYIADDQNIPEYMLESVIQQSIEEMIRYIQGNEDDDLSNWGVVSGLTLTDMVYKKKSKNNHHEKCYFTLVKTFESDTKSMFSLFVNGYEQNICLKTKHINQKIPKQKKRKMKKYSSRR